MSKSFKVIILVALVGGLLGISSPLKVQAASPTLSFQASKTTIAVGEQLTVNVLINAQGESVSAAELHISFPSATLQAQSISAGSFLPTVLSAGAVGSGTASIILGSQVANDEITPATGSGTLATIVFTGLASGSATVSFNSSTGVAVIGQTQNYVGTKTPLSLTVAASSDTTDPTVSLSAPANGATVSKTTSITATASDNVGVVGVQFKLDGTNLGSEDTTSSYSYSWDTTTASNGSHTLSAVARDAAGHSTTSTSVSVTVNNNNPVTDTTPPTISVVASSGISQTGATITWTTNEASDSQVEYGVTTSYGQSTTLNTSLVTSHTITLSSLSSNTFYHYRVKSKDAAGNPSVSADKTLTTLAASGGGGGGSSGGGGGSSGGGSTPPSTTPTTTPVVPKTTIPVIPQVTTIPGCSGKTTGFSTVNGQSCSGNTAIVTISTPTVIPGCAGRTTGFSTVNGQSCAGNTGGATTTTPYNFGTVTLRNGSRGAAVMELQRFLNDKLHLGLKLDGILGPKTIAVIRQWQKNHGLVVDGLVGPKTKALMNAEAQ